MRRTCERPGCSAPVAVIYGYVQGGESMQIWLDSWPVERVDAEWPDGARGVVCERHGSMLSPPQGWGIVDRREAMQQLFRPRPVLVHSRDESEEVVRPADDSAADRRRRVADLPPPQLFSEMRSDPADDRDEVLPSDAAAECAQDATGDDSLSALLDAAGPLLRRAFAKGNTGRSDASKELMRPTTDRVVDESA